MDILFEILGEMFFESLFLILENKKISKFIRYPLFVFVCLFYFIFIGLFFYLAVNLFLKGNIGGSILLFLLGIFVLILFLYVMFKKRKSDG